MMPIIWAAGSAFAAATYVSHWSPVVLGCFVFDVLMFVASIASIPR